MLFASDSAALAARYQQTLDPLKDAIPGSAFVSTLFAALPVVVLFWLLVPRRWLASKAGAAASAVAILIAIAVFRMPIDMAASSFLFGAAFGLLPIGWTIFNAMLLYNITVETGRFAIVRRSVASLSRDARIQALLIGFSFGAFLEGAAGGGSPVAICGAIMVGLGFEPFLAAVLCLIANTSPVAYGGLGTPLLVLAGVTDIPVETLSVMAGNQLPIISVFVPLYMIKCMCSWRQTWEIWPALLVTGGSFAAFQYVFATMHIYVPGVVLFPMTDIGGGIFSLVVTAVFLRFWQPRHLFVFDKNETKADAPAADAPAAKLDPNDPHAAEASALVAPPSPTHAHFETVPLSFGNVAMAWMPFILMSVFLMLTGIVRQKEGGTRPGPGPIVVSVGGIEIATNYGIPIPGLNKQSARDPRLLPPGKEGETESAVFNFCWFTAPGTAVCFAGIVSIFLLRMSGAQTKAVLRRTCLQMKIPIPTIAFMLGLSYVTRYAGMDATLGYAFSGTGVLYPFFAAILGWLGVFLTGTDAGSNALFGSLQKITASEVYKTGAFALTEPQAQVLICTANSTGGVMGKMIDAQSICVATAATNQLGKEADIFKAVLWHSVFLASVVGVMTLIQAYVVPFNKTVPEPPAAVAPK